MPPEPSAASATCCRRICCCRGAPCSITSSSAWRSKACRCARRASGRCRCCGATGSPASNISIRTRCLAHAAGQRAALLRTLFFDTDVILLDEPFGALDAQTKLQMQEWLLGLWADFGKTVVFVTHDIEEAIYLSDEVFVMATRPGRIVESMPVPIARPRERGATLTPEFMAIKERCLALLMAGHDSPLSEAA